MLTPSPVIFYFYNFIFTSLVYNIGKQEQEASLRLEDGDNKDLRNVGNTTSFYVVTSHHVGSLLALNWRGNLKLSTTQRKIIKLIILRN